MLAGALPVARCVRAIPSGWRWTLPFRPKLLPCRPNVPMPGRDQRNRKQRPITVSAVNPWRMHFFGKSCLPFCVLGAGGTAPRCSPRPRIIPVHLVIFFRATLPERGSSFGNSVIWLSGTQFDATICMKLLVNWRCCPPVTPYFPGLTINHLNLDETLT
jgi:hypothetical protein